MSGRNVVTLDQNRRSQRLFPDEIIIAMLVFLIFDAMILAGIVGGFMLTRATAGVAWPPAGQPWFPPEYTAINSAALLISAVLVFLSARAWKKQTSHIGPLLLAAIVLGIFFVFSQGVLWVGLIRQGLTLGSSQHGALFSLIMATHGAHAVGALGFLGCAWLRLKRLRDDDPDPRGSLRSDTFWAARLLWYFTVAVWPVLYVCLYR
jgi:heme/copper-type cytochrome/quinol oxidase subunit 3